MISNRRQFLKYLGAGGLGGLLGAGGTGNILSHWYQSQLNDPAAPLEGRAVEPASVELGANIRLHHIQTGYVAVKRAHRDYSGADGTGILAIAADQRWTDWMPVNTWLIEHPEGLIVVDTGESAKATDPAYFDCDGGTRFFYSSFLRFAVTPEDEIGAQMATLDIPSDEVRWVVQTHLHGDHVGGLGNFNEAEVFVPRQDYPNSVGTLPCRYPANFSPTLTSFDKTELGPFTQAKALTQAGDVWIIPTPGHSEGHQSVLLQVEGLSYFLAGDVSFDEAQLLSGKIGGIVQNPKANRQSLAAIREYCQVHPTVYLPSHDPQARERLQNRQVVQV